MPLCRKHKTVKKINAENGRRQHCRWHDTDDIYCQNPIVYEGAKICPKHSEMSQKCEVCLCSLQKSGFFGRLFSR